VRREGKTREFRFEFTLAFRLMPRAYFQLYFEGRKKNDL
jgi:hypothetical protein